MADIIDKSKETGNIPVSTLELMDLLKNEQQIQSIRQAIESQSGTLPTFVHPLFHQYELGQKSERLLDPSILSAKSDETEYLLKLSRFLNKNVPIILLFEVQRYVEKTTKIFRNSGYKGTIITVATTENDPTMLKGDMDDLVAILTELNVKEIIVGGEYGVYERSGREISEPTTNKRHISYDLNTLNNINYLVDSGFAGRYCVGIFMKELVSSLRTAKASGEPVSIQKMTLSPIVYN